MNMELTAHIAQHKASVRANPEALLAVPASTTMQDTGNVFEPNYYLLDEAAGIVYRKEQFTAGPSLPAEFIVRDRRYSRSELAAMCLAAGFSEEWVRYVQAGRWNRALDALDPRAKEVLYLGTRRS